MSGYEARVEGHGAHGATARLLTRLDEGKSDDEARLAAVTRLVQRSIENSDSLLVGIPVLDEVENLVAKAETMLNQYEGDGSETHLEELRKVCDALVSTALRLPAFDRREGLADIRAEVTSFRRSAGQLTSALRTEVEGAAAELQEIAGRLAAYRGEVEAERIRIDSALNEYQQQFSSSQESRSNEFEKFRSSRGAEWTAALEEARSKLRMVEGEWQTVRERMNADFAEDHEEALALAKRVHADIEKLRDDAARVVGVVGNIGLTGDYQGHANSESRNAFWWSIAAIGFFIGAVVLGLVFVAGSDEGISTTDAIRKIATTLVVLVPATYCGSRARDHRRAERKYRGLELQLASLNPYVAPLPEDLQHAMKSSLASRYFTGELSEVETLEVEPWLTRIQRARKEAEQTKSD